MVKEPGMRTEQFHRLIREQGAYETGTPSRGVGDRLFWWSDTWYYLKILGVVVRASIKARRGRYDVGEWARSAHETINVVEACGGRVKISGINHVIRLSGPRVYIANHMSMLETMALPACLLPFGNLTTVVKESLLEYPLFGVVLRALDPISVTRRNARADLKEVLQKGRATINNGRSILVFPQATRSREFRADHFNSLGVKLAQRSRVPVLPVAVKSDFQGIGRVFRDMGKVHRDQVVHFAIGPPMSVGDDAKAVHQAVIDVIGGNLRNWGVTVR